MKRCAIWCEPAKRPRKISFAHGIGWVSFCCGTAGVRPKRVKAWTKKYLEWIKTHVRFDQPALEATLAHYLHEVEHAAERILKLEKAIDEAVGTSQSGDSRGDRSVAGVARRGPDDGRYDRLRTRQPLALSRVRGN